MTTFHHKLLTKKVGRWQWMNSSAIRDNICSLIHKKRHPKGYHSDIKYHMTLDIIFGVVREPSYHCYQSVLPISRTGLSCGRAQFHDSGPFALPTSWILQINFINLFALYDFCILNLSTSCLPIVHSLPSRCSSVPLCCVSTWKPLALTSNFLWSFITISQC